MASQRARTHVRSSFPGSRTLQGGKGEAGKRRRGKHSPPQGPGWRSSATAPDAWADSAAVQHDCCWHWGPSSPRHSKPNSPGGAGLCAGKGWGPPTPPLRALGHTGREHTGARWAKGISKKGRSLCYLRTFLPEIPLSSWQGDGKDRGVMHSALPHSLAATCRDNFRGKVAH